MIKLNNINIKFNKDIITNSYINLPKGKLISLIGKSGSGKTTLLYMIGLISSNSTYEYIFDNEKIDLSNDKLKGNIRKNKIGYIFQDDNLIEELTVYANIKLASELSGKLINDEEISSLLEYVGVNIDKTAYPRQLSGGERQRTSIASALSKNPEIIIADEPTSALDEENSNLIMDILRKIAYIENKHVIIATHDSTIYNQCDIIYEINNKTINLIKGNEEIHEDEIANKDMSFINKLSSKFYIRYTKNRNKNPKESIKNKIMILLCAFTIAFTAISYTLGKDFIKEQETYTDYMANKEIFLVNNSFPLPGNHDKDFFKSIDNDDVKKISDIIGIEEYFGYFEFSSEGTKAYPDDSSDIYLRDSTIQIKQNDNVINTIAVGNSNTSAEYIDKYSIIPYFPHQEMDRKSVILAEEISEGIYLSSELAEILNLDNINNLNNISLVFDALVPVKQSLSAVIMDEITYEADSNLYVKIQLEFPVKGILDNNISNSYSDSGQNNIYMDYSKMKDILEEYKDDNLIVGTAYSPDYVEKEFESSSYIILAESFDSIDSVVAKLKGINPNFSVIKSSQNFEAMKDSVNQIRKSISTMSLVIISVVFILMSIIYMLYVDKRKYEIAVLKANGLTKIEVNKIIYTESFSHIIKTFIGSIIFAFIFKLLALLIPGFSDLIGIGIQQIFIMLVISILSIFIPTIITIYFVNKYNPDTIMRN